MNLMWPIRRNLRSIWRLQERNVLHFEMAERLRKDPQPSPMTSSSSTTDKRHSSGMPKRLVDTNAFTG